MAGEHDDASGDVACAKVSEHVETVHVLEPQVEENDVDVRARGGVQGLAAGRAGVDVVAPPGQLLAHHAPECGVVVHQQHTNVSS